MKHVSLLLSIICVLFFVACGQDDKTEKAAEMVKEKAEETAGKVEDVIKMKNKAYAEHTESIVMFTHKKHEKEYAEKHPDLYKNGCGECHHDKDNKPLIDLKEGDEVQNCIECHKKPEYIKGKEARELTDEQKREYHANAIHDNCKGCHRKFNKKMNLKVKDEGAAPVTCKQCHPEEK